MVILIITTEIQPKAFYPVDALNLLDGIQCEIVENTAIISVDTDKYNTPQSIFNLGRFVELRVANEQLRHSNNLIGMLVKEKRELRKENKDSI